MRLLTLLLVLGACGTDSPEERLDSYIAEVEIDCGSICPSNIGCNNTSPTRVLQCMNDALANGKRAQAENRSQDEKGYYVNTYAFTVDHKILSFEDHPIGDLFNGDRYTYDQPTCSGPFRLEETYPVELVWGGCPAK